MPAWPKSILSFGANLLTARTVLHLKRPRRGPGQQTAAFASLVGHLYQTSFWREAGVARGMRYEDYRTRVTPRTYADVATAIGRMQHGEADVLWPGRCAFFAASSGTTSGAAQVVPVTAPMLAHFRRGCRDALLYYMARKGHAGIIGGRHLFLTGSTALKPLNNGGPHQAFVGEWPAIAALNLPRWAENQLYEPGPQIAGMTNWGEKLQAIIARTAGSDVSLIAGMPPWVLTFSELVRARRAEAGAPVDNLEAIWPNLECFVHGGVPIGPYQSELRAALGPSVDFHEVYAGAEGVFAAQDGSGSGELRLMTNLGVFFEFIPLADYDESRLAGMGEKAVQLAEVKAGVDYVLLVSSPAGLARYVVGDIVRFTSTQPPRLRWVGRTALQLSAFGERVLESEITDALVAVCQKHGWSPVNFHVAPLFGLALTGQTRGRHEWWVELKPGTVETPTGPQMAAELDHELQHANRDYASRRASGRIDAPTVRLVMPGVFRHWMNFHGLVGGEYKMARCRSDRRVADELAQITKFAQD